MFASRDHVDGEAGRVDVVFTDRHGGVSPSPYDSLDLGGARADRPDVARNFALLATELGVARLVTMRQRHGSAVAYVGESTAADVVPGAGPECDALVTDVPGRALCVRAGDCVPVVLADADQGVVAVAHAGRRGVVAGIAGATVAAMRERGAASVTAWIGPHICSGCYEVPADMRAEVAEVAPAAFACTTTGTPAVDLGAAVAAQLAAAGCQVVDRSVCTLESRDLFSYRRDAERSGRTAGIVVLRPAVDA